MNILLMISVMEVGGAQNALLELAGGLRNRGHQVTILTMHDRGEVIPRLQIAHGTKIINVEMRRSGTRGRVAAFLLLVCGLWRMYRQMKAGRYDILQTFLIYGNVIGQCVGALAGIPVRVSSQRNRNDDFSWLTRVLDRLVANSLFTHKMVAVSEATRSYCVKSLGIRREKLVTIHNGISLRPNFDSDTFRRLSCLRREFGLDECNIVASTVARLSPQKGHCYLLEAVARLTSSSPQLRLLLIGDGPLNDELSKIIERCNLSQRVSMLGNRADVGDILAISDLFVLPSVWEGLPNSVLEAMASSLPVIATDVDGTAEAVVDGVTGLLVPPRNPGALASAITELSSDAEKRRKMGAAGRSRVEQQFSTEDFVRSFEELYIRLAA